MRIVYSPRLSTQPFLPPLLPLSVWNKAREDLDELHRSVSNPSYFEGTVYFITSKEERRDGERVQIDYQLTYSSKSWISSCVCYFDNEDSPEPWKVEYTAEKEKEQEQKESNEEQEETYREYEHFCFGCKVETQRTCHECGISICDGCCPNGNLCHYCISDQLEYE